MIPCAGSVVAAKLDPRQIGIVHHIMQGPTSCDFVVDWRGAPSISGLKAEKVTQLILVRY